MRLYLSVRVSLVIAVLLSSPFAIRGARGQSPAVSFDDIAHFVAGMPLSPSSPLSRLSSTRSVIRHSNAAVALNRDWQDKRLNQIRGWARKEIHPHLTRPKVVKYPFGGPDFVHAVTFFPGVDEYVLVGLEPLGSLPDFLGMQELELDAYLNHLTHTLRSISRRSFFITTEMREDFGKQGVDGVYPVLLYFAALTDHTVLDGRYVKLNGSGGTVECSKDEADGIWLQLRADERMAGFPETQNLYYFKTDLSNSGFKPGSPFLKFLEQRPDGVGYLKAASFLMHTDSFSNVRNFLVGNCKFVLQDASGIPAEFFSTYFNVTYYGNYVGPIDMFSEYDQPFLHRIYQSGAAGALPFGTGYRMKDSDAIQMFGIRK